MKRFKNTFTALSFVFLICGISNPVFSQTSRTVEELKLTPNQKLLFAVKGIKSGAAIIAAMLWGPIAGAIVAASPSYESTKDLLKIDSALKDGADINFQEKRTGYTALLYAAYDGYPKIAKHLIEWGANLELKEQDGYNAYTMAKYYLDYYTEEYKINEAKALSEDFTEENRENMRNHCQDYINRYNELVNLLKPLTVDQSMPKNSWFENSL